MQYAAGRHSKFLLAAAAEAENSTLQIKHGAILVRGGKIVGAGHNSDRSRLCHMPGGAANTISLHSELVTEAAVMYKSLAHRKPLAAMYLLHKQLQLANSPRAGCVRVKMVCTVPRNSVPR
ncbi:MAG: hypothetical protein SGPRY_005916 [Prymnesium sp.]